MFRTFIRNRLRRRPLPPEWEAILGRNLPLYRILPPADQAELHGHLHVLLAEKSFEGCAGVTVTEEMCLTIAAQAALLLLHREEDYFPGLRSILVYPDAFVAPCDDRDELGVVTEGDEVRTGESWDRGAVVLAWDEVLASAAEAPGEYNVVLHEFAHQLDAEDGGTNGSVFLPPSASSAAWAEVMNAEYQRLRRDAGAGRETVLDPYGAEHPAEFFAVATECFFQDAERLREGLPALYEQLRLFYRQDPASFRWDLLEKPPAARASPFVPLGRTAKTGRKKGGAGGRPCPG